VASFCVFIVTDLLVGCPFVGSVEVLIASLLMFFRLISGIGALAARLFWEQDQACSIRASRTILCRGRMAMQLTVNQLFCDVPYCAKLRNAILTAWVGDFLAPN